MEHPAGTWYVYMITNRPHGTLYTGSTNDLSERMQQHRDKLVEGFSKKYNLRRLVHAEAYATMPEARLREHRLKRWRRAWKDALIEETNPRWDDLCDTLEL